MGGVYLLVSGNLTVTEGGTVTSTCEKYSTLYVSGGEVKTAGTYAIYLVAGSSLHVTDNGDDPFILGNVAVQTNGKESPGVTIDISGGTIKGYTAGIFLASGKLDVRGDAKIEGYYGIGVRGGTLNVSGGTITATGSKDT